MRLAWDFASATLTRAKGLQFGLPRLAYLVKLLLPVFPVIAQRMDDRFCYDEIAIPLRVRRDDDPRRVPGRGLGDRVLVGAGVVVPVLALLPVIEIELPGLLRLG